jgi:hypothetical protein
VKNSLQLGTPLLGNGQGRLLKLKKLNVNIAKVKLDKI